MKLLLVLLIVLTVYLTGCGHKTVPLITGRKTRTSAKPALQKKGRYFRRSDSRAGTGKRTAVRLRAYLLSQTAH